MNALVVGSSVIDLFLQIEDENHLKVLDRNVSFQLGDKIPVNIRTLTLGGNGANVSVGLKRLGIHTKLFTYLGSDIFSKEIEETFEKEGIECMRAQDSGQKSSLSFIFDIASDRIIFSHHEARNHTFSYQEPQLPEFIFLTSIGKEWKSAYQHVLNFAKQHAIPLSLNPGSVQLSEKTDTLLEMLLSTKLLFVNKEEARTLLSWKNMLDTDIKDILSQLKTLGPKIVVVTDGKQGAYCQDEQHNSYWIRPFGDTIVEKTGAGDAFTSGFLAKYLLSGSVPDAMIWGAVNSHYSIQKIGSQEGLLKQKEMEQMINEHREFQVEKIE